MRKWFTLLQIKSWNGEIVFRHYIDEFKQHSSPNSLQLILAQTFLIKYWFYMIGHRYFDFQQFWGMRKPGLSSVRKVLQISLTCCVSAKDIDMFILETEYNTQMFITTVIYGIPWKFLKNQYQLTNHPHNV